MRTLRTWAPLMILLSILPGCGGLFGGVQPTSLCGEERGGEKRWTALDLVRSGNAYLEGSSETASVNATICYTHALQINPEDYGAHLGLGVANIMIGRRTGQPEYFNTARTHLATALAVRPFHFEVVYYLAELAVLEDKYELAQAFLDPLLKAGYKKGPVYTLAGDVYRHLGDSKKAREFYMIGAREGWPVMTARYARERM